MDVHMFQLQRLTTYKKQSISTVVELLRNLLANEHYCVDNLFLLFLFYSGQ